MENGTETIIFFAIVFFSIRDGSLANVVRFIAMLYNVTIVEIRLPLLFLSQTHMKHLGFQGTSGQMIAIWKRNAADWQKRRSPWRPSKGDISLYKKSIDEKLPGQILILGATPELRDLIASTDTRVVLIDICPEMIASTSRLLAVSRPEDEKHVVADWRKMPFPDSSFDVIVGDFFWWLFSVANQGLLRDEIARVLKPDGILVSRIHFCNTKFVGADLEGMIKKHLSRLTEDNASQNDMKELLLYRLLDATTDTASQRLDTTTAAAAIEKLLSENTGNELRRSFLEKCAAALRGRVDWSSQTREQILECLEKRFVLENEAPAEDYEDSRFFPILKFRNRTVR
jgi:SAM-dependent methyltransferase